MHDIQFFDLGDYPLELDREAKYRLVDVIRAVQPAFMLSHSHYDPYNTDHMYTTQVVLETRMIAQAWGHNPGQKVLGAPQLYVFEPHQTEQMGWKPDTFLDITPVWERKRAAIECMAGQEHLWAFYTRVAQQRANHFKRNSGGQSGGVLGAVSVATACLSKGTVAHPMSVIPKGVKKRMSIEHPGGEMTVLGHLEAGVVIRTEVLRTARKLMDGLVFPGA